MWHLRHIFISDNRFSVDPDHVTAPMPKILWVELTSKCPFDCIFCTRRVRFGTGRNLNFDVYKKLIAELESPDFIGLNYSGESIYYPQLLDAIQLAGSTGASTELVTAFSTISERTLRGIVESGLDRLAISLHTMDPDQYRKIYRFGSLDLLKQRIDDFMEMRSALGGQKPRLDFCFVAMNENLDQLRAVVEYAKEIGVPEIFVHPIIGRHLIPHDFSIELSNNQLREGFKEKLRSSIASVRAAHPDLPVTILNPDVQINPKLDRAPRYYTPSLPHNARIYSCDQTPFESVHVLASGNVVVCEVHDEVSLGNLHEQSLREIWSGERYREFRQKYVTDPPQACRNCPWKIAYAPDRWRSAIVVRDGMTPQLLRGWHAYDGMPIIWSKRQALLVLKGRKASRRLHIIGVLPPGPRGQTNSLGVSCNNVAIDEIKNQSGTIMPFETILPLSSSAEYLYLDFSTAHLFRPALQGLNNDSRDLGFGLQRIEVCR